MEDRERDEGKGNTLRAAESRTGAGSEEAVLDQGFMERCWSQEPRHWTDYRSMVYVLAPARKFKLSRMFSGPKNSREFLTLSYIVGRDRQMERNLQAGLGLSCSARRRGSDRLFWTFGKAHCQRQRLVFQLTLEA